MSSSTKMSAEPRETGVPYCALPHLADEIAIHETGDRQFGPYRMRWRSSRAFGFSQKGAYTEFTVEGLDGQPGTCRLNACCPPTVIIRKGIDGTWQGRRLRIVRNGPRPLNIWRRTSIEADETRWVARGLWNGTVLEDTTTGQVLWRSHGRRSEMPGDLPSSRAALVVALAANEIPQSMCLTFARI